MLAPSCGGCAAWRQFGEESAPQATDGFQWSLHATLPLPPTQLLPPHPPATRRDVLRESARAEFEAARFEGDPEIVSEGAAGSRLPLSSPAARTGSLAGARAPLAPSSGTLWAAPTRAPRFPLPCSSGQPAAGGGARCGAPRGRALPGQAAADAGRCRSSLPSRRRRRRRFWQRQLWRCRRGRFWQRRLRRRLATAPWRGGAVPSRQPHLTAWPVLADRLVDCPSILWITLLPCVVVQVMSRPDWR